MWTDSRKTKRQKTAIRKRTSRGFLFFLLFCTVLLTGLSAKKAQAASASITIDTSKKQVVKGDTVYVVITVSSSDSIKSFTGYFSYDNRYLQFVNGGSVVHGNDDKFLVDDINRTSSATKLKYSIKFKARKKGSTTIALQKPYKVCADDSSSGEMSVSYNALNIAVLSKKEAVASSQPQQSNTATALPNASNRPQTEASGKPETSPDRADAKNEPDPSKDPKASAAPEVTRGPDDIAGSSRLRKLSIADAQIAPEFQPSIRKYSGFVTTNQDTLDISYEAEDSKASVTVKGNKNLKEGKHTIKIVVTSVNHKKTVYRFQLNVTKQDQAKDGANSIQITQTNGKTYLSGGLQIELLELEDESLLPDDFSKTTIEIAGNEITAYALDGSTDYNYVLLYGKSDAEGFFLYDKQEEALYPYEKVKQWYRSQSEDSQDSTQTQTIRSYQYIIAIMAVLCVLMLVITIAFGLHRNYQKEIWEQEIEEDENEEDKMKEDR